MKNRYMLIVLVVIIFAGMVVAEPVFADYPWPQDLGGRTIQIRTRWGAVTPFGLRGEFDFYDPDERVQAHIDQVEEMFNVNIEFLTDVSRTPEDIATRVMIGEQADYMFTGRKYIAELVAQGLVEPLSDHLDQAYYDAFPPSFRPTPETTDFMGETYAFQAKNYTLHPWSVIFNKDMFEREGLPSPYDLQESGEWTFETVLDLSQRLTRDTTGDGEIDQYGITGFRWYFLPLLNDGNLARYEDGRWKATLNEPQVVEAIDYKQEILEDGTGNFGQGTAGMTFIWADAVAYDWFRDMDEDFGIVLPPMGPSADDYVSHSAGVHLGYIPIGNEDPRAVIEVVSALWKLTEPYMDVSLEEWEDNLWRERALLLRDRESMENWKWLMRNVQPLDYWRIIEMIGFNDEVINPVVDQGVDASTALHEFNPVFQSYLDDLFRQ